MTPTRLRRLSITLGLVVGLAATAGIVVARLRAHHVPQPQHWTGPVVVVVDEIAVDRMDGARRAVEWWHARGWDIAVLGVGDYATAPDGDVLLTEPSGTVAFADDSGELGVCATRSDGDRIVSATIAIDPVIAVGSEREVDVLRHELGHALGFGHAAFTGSVMSNGIEAFGKDDAGLRAP